MNESGDTKSTLLRAAIGEFAAYGYSGARINRIAETAGINKRMIYVHFGNKDKLFDAVISASLDELMESVEVDVDDLPEYAGRLFDFLIAHPERRRLTLWRLLERPETTSAERRSTQTKLQALSGVAAHADLDAATLLVFIMALVQAWPNASPALARAQSSRAVQRASVVEAVRRLATP